MWVAKPSVWTRETSARIAKSNIRTGKPSSRFAKLCIWIGKLGIWISMLEKKILLGSLEGLLTMIKHQVPFYFWMNGKSLSVTAYIKRTAY